MQLSTIWAICRTGSRGPSCSSAGQSSCASSRRPHRYVPVLTQHLADDTEGVWPTYAELWQHACLRDFSDIRKLHEDGTLPPPTSWRTLYNVGV